MATRKTPMGRLGVKPSYHPDDWTYYRIEHDQQLLETRSNDCRGGEYRAPFAQALEQT
jgi:hypothetical protein